MTHEQRMRAGPEGLWSDLAAMESLAAARLGADLSLFQDPVRLLFEAGVQAPMLKAVRAQELDLCLAGVFLKRTLTDLRSIWLLVNCGYTSQASSVAAALFEHALAVCLLAGSDERARRLVAETSGDLPWSVLDLCRAWAERHAATERKRGVSRTSIEIETDSLQVYAAYKWLCKIKHPTLRSTVHDAGATAHSSTYMIMCAPDTRESDLSVKAVMLSAVLDRVHWAIRHFADGREPDATDTQYGRFESRLAEATRLASAAWDATVKQPLPFDVADEIRSMRQRAGI